MQFGGHRWACSGYMQKELVFEFFNEMLKYHKQLKAPPELKEESAEVKEVSSPDKPKVKIKTGQFKLDQFL